MIMPLDPESLILMPNPLAATLSGLNPLDPDVRMAAIEAARRIIRRFRLTDDESRRLVSISNSLSRKAFVNVVGCVPYPLPAQVSDEELAEWFKEERTVVKEIADGRAFYHRRLNGEMTYSTAGTLLRWLSAHPQGATPAEVDLLASLHDELLNTNVSDEWARLLRILAPDRARRLAKTTPDSDVCSFLLSGTPEDHALFMSRFPNWAEEEKRRERELLDSLDDDDWL